MGNIRRPGCPAVTPPAPVTSSVAFNGEDLGYGEDLGAWGVPNAPGNPDPPGLLDACCTGADQPGTADAFDRSVRYEIAFWQMAYTRGESDHA
jgi:hypothetical protein